MTSRRFRLNWMGYVADAFGPTSVLGDVAR